LLWIELPAKPPLDRKPVVEPAVDGLGERFKHISPADSEADKGDNVGEQLLRAGTPDLGALELLIGVPEKLGGELVGWLFDGIGELLYRAVGKMALEIGLAVEYLEGSKFVLVVFNKLSKGINNGLSLLFCLRVKADEDELVLADGINNLLAFSLEFDEEFAQFWIIERRTNSFG